jgi:hypothetical protein
MMLQFGSSAEGLGKPWQPGAKRFNRIVFIGVSLHAGAQAAKLLDGGSEQLRRRALHDSCNGCALWGFCAGRPPAVAVLRMCPDAHHSFLLQAKT